MQLDRSDIDLWHVDAENFELSQLEAGCLSWLNGKELRRCQRLYFASHRKHLLLGRFLIRSVLSEYAPETQASEWCFTENQYGKPAIDTAHHHCSLFFNLSHSAGKLVLAVARIEPIGVDIESSTKARRILQIANRFFSEQEVIDLLRLKEDQQQQRFYELWTLKEAYIKACGQGLAIPLKHFSFSLLSTKQIVISFDGNRNDNADSWQFWVVDAGSNHKLAVAVKSPTGSAVQRINSRELLGMDITKSSNLLETTISRSSQAR